MEIITAKGAYSFHGSDGRIYGVEYQADENGYRPIVKFGTDNLLKQMSTPRAPIKPPFVPYIGRAVISSLVGGGLG